VYWLIEHWLKLVIAVICLAIGFATGQLTFQPRVVEVERIEYLTVIQEVPVLVPVEVEKPYYITVVEKELVEVATTVYRDIHPRSFGSVATFKEWYQDQTFVVSFSEDEEDNTDYSVKLQQEALKEGYSVSQALAKDGKYYGIKVTGEKGGHTGNLVLIKGTYYWVEPHPAEFEVIKLVKRD